MPPPPPPPPGPFPLPIRSGLLIVGIFSILTGILGAFLGYCGRCCNSMYLVLGGLLTIAELGITLSLFFNLDNATSNIVTRKYFYGGGIASSS